MPPGSLPTSPGHLTHLTAIANQDRASWPFVLFTGDPALGPTPAITPAYSTFPLDLSAPPGQPRLQSQLPTEPQAQDMSALLKAAFTHAPAWSPYQSTSPHLAPSTPDSPLRHTVSPGKLPEFFDKDWKDDYSERSDPYEDDMADTLGVDWYTEQRLGLAPAAFSHPFLDPASSAGPTHLGSPITVALVSRSPTAVAVKLGPPCLTPFETESGSNSPAVINELARLGSHTTTDVDDGGDGDLEYVPVRSASRPVRRVQVMAKAPSPSPVCAPTATSMHPRLAPNSKNTTMPSPANKPARAPATNPKSNPQAKQAKAKRTRRTTGKANATRMAQNRRSQEDYRERKQVHHGRCATYMETTLAVTDLLFRGKMAPEEAASYLFAAKDAYRESLEALRSKDAENLDAKVQAKIRELSARL